MSAQRLVLAAVLVFVLAWGTLAALSIWKSTAVSEPLARRALTREEIARHDRPEDCWIVIGGNVYDVTRYIPSHPAPPQTITDHCGKESTRAFETKDRGRPHSPRAWRLLDTYLVGEARD